MPIVRTPDGDEYDVPEFALDETAQKMLKELEKIHKEDVKSNDTVKKSQEKLVRSTNDRAKAADKSEAAHLKAQNDQLDALKDIKENTDGFISSLMPWVTGFTIAAGLMTSAALAVGGLLLKGTMNLGDTLGQLAEFGVGFDTDAFSSNTIATITALNRLGLPIEDAALIMRDYSDVVQGIGQRSFVELNQELAKTTGFGAEFGLTMREMTNYLAEDLKLREQLGILDQIDSVKQAKLTEDLYRQQLEATVLLGKSIRDIRGAADNTIDSNARFALAMQAMGSEGENFLQTFRIMSGDLAGMNVPQSIIDSLGTVFSDVNAFMQEDTMELFQTLATMGAAGSETAIAMQDQLTKINQLRQAGDFEAMQREMAKIPSMFAGIAKDFEGEPEKFQAMIALLSQTPGRMATEMSLAIGQMRRAAERMESGVQDAVKFPELARSSAAFSQSMELILGSLSSMLNTALGSMGSPLKAFSDALHESSDDQKSIMMVFESSINDITTAIAEATGFASQSGDDFKSLTDRVREFSNNTLKGWSESIIKFINDTDFDALATSFKQTIEGLGTMVSYIVKVPQMIAETDWTSVFMKALAGGALVAGLLAGGAAAGAGKGAIGGAAMAGFINPGTLLTLGAVTAAVIGLAYALDTAKEGLEPFGNMIKSVFEGMNTFVGGTIDGIYNGIAKVTGAVTDFRNAGAQAEALNMEAATAATERLSSIDPGRLMVLGDAVTELTGSLSGLGGALGGESLIPGLDSGLNVAKLNDLASAYGKFAELDSEMMLASAYAINRINESIGDQQGSTVITSIAERLGFGSTETPTQAPTQALAAPVTAQVAQAARTTPTRSGEDMGSLLVALISESQLGTKELKKIRDAIEKQA